MNYICNICKKVDLEPSVPNENHLYCNTCIKRVKDIHKAVIVGIMKKGRKDIVKNTFDCCYCEGVIPGARQYKRKNSDFCNNCYNDKVEPAFDLCQKILFRKNEISEESRIEGRTLYCTNCRSVEDSGVRELKNGHKMFCFECTSLVNLVYLKLVDSGKIDKCN